MITRFTEVTSGIGNYGKFGVGWFTRGEWARHAVLPELNHLPLLRVCGWWPGDHEPVWVLDLQTGEGAYFTSLGSGAAVSELDRKHKIWVCPLYPAFLGWLDDFIADNPAPTWWELLPDLLDIPAVPFSFAGHRRAGTDLHAPTGSGWPVPHQEGTR